jgi:hypothetical protein
MNLIRSKFRDQYRLLRNHDRTNRRTERRCTSVWNLLPFNKKDSKIRRKSTSNQWSKQKTSFLGYCIGRQLRGELWGRAFRRVGECLGRCAGGRTAVAPRSARSKAPHNAFVTAMTLKVGFKNPGRHVTSLWKMYPKCLFEYLQYCSELKTDYLRKII